jgi:hypothetical protein
MPTQPSHAWSSLKPHLKELDKDALILLLRDLHALNVENRLFLAARFQTATVDELAEPYRAVISAAFTPPHLDVRAARQAVNDFQKLLHEPLPVIDLLLFYVEQGVLCTTTYGDIGAAFYDSLDAAFLRAARMAAELADPATITALRPRFAAIADAVGNVGWGMYEAMQNTYQNIFPPEAPAPSFSTAVGSP